MAQKEKGHKKKGRPQPDVGLAELQLAALATGAALVSSWAQMANGYADRVGKLVDATRKKRLSFADATEQGLREYQDFVSEMMDLPRVYGLRFYGELARARDRSGKTMRRPRKKRTRKA